MDPFDIYLVETQCPINVIWVSKDKPHHAIQVPSYNDCFFNSLIKMIGLIICCEYRVYIECATASIWCIALHLGKLHPPSILPCLPSCLAPSPTNSLFLSFFLYLHVVKVPSSCRMIMFLNYPHTRFVVTDRSTVLLKTMFQCYLHDDHGWVMFIRSEILSHINAMTLGKCNLSLANFLQAYWWLRHYDDWSTVYKWQ